MEEKNLIPDSELDQLLSDMFQREQVLEQVSERVMQTIRSQRRRAMWKRALRVLAFAFGLPLVAMFCLSTLLPMLSQSDPRLTVAALIAIAAIVGCLLNSVTDYSVGDFPTAEV